MTRILIIEDRDSLREMLEEFLSSHEVLSVSSAEDAQPLLLHYPEIVLCDLKLPGMSGIDFIRKTAPEFPDTIFIIMTAFGDIPTAVNAMKAGAYEFLPKPLDLNHLSIVLKRAGEILKLRRVANSGNDTVILGKSPAMMDTLKLAARVAPLDCPVLLAGESGTGKEVLSRWIHSHSPRKNHTFWAVNCAAIPESLLESELFGHEPGAFTGATRLKKGYFELADESTLFLDEIDKTSAAFQAKILRTVDTGEFYRLGSNIQLNSRARLIFATNRKPEELADSDNFRKDLFHRISAYIIAIPPLRNRHGDIPLLAQYFADKLGRQINGKPMPLPDTALRQLEAYQWPGNVRELRNTIERWAILGIDPTVGSAGMFHRESGTYMDFEGKNYEEILRELEEKLFRYHLAKQDGNKLAVSRLLDMNYKTFLSRLRKLGIET
ncbi:MAG: sigma-54-dependent Fis family transcriptional regulator [Acidobacteria bacterium]|nr:sigma-54-dependent Fis family transcriptional regulator [Acidobacteriota bacterium]